MRHLLLPLAFLSLALTGAIFGFFYAWVCSTMWGLDATDPRVAIQAMQAMNASVRNIVFAPAFFGTPFALIATGALGYAAGRHGAAAAFFAAGILYLFGGMVLTMAVNVPMNEALGALAIPEDLAEAEAIWTAYSPRWQIYNQARTLVSLIALMLTGFGIYVLRPGSV